MSIIKSISVGDGDMFYIKHGSDNFTNIDCSMDDYSKDKYCIRFISTQPDDENKNDFDKEKKFFIDLHLANSKYYLMVNDTARFNILDNQSSIIKEGADLNNCIQFIYSLLNNPETWR